MLVQHSPAGDSQCLYCSCKRTDETTPHRLVPLWEPEPPLASTAHHAMRHPPVRAFSPIDDLPCTVHWLQTWNPGN